MRPGAGPAGIRVLRIGPAGPAPALTVCSPIGGDRTTAIRASLHRRGIAHTIGERNDQNDNRRRKDRAGGRPPAFDPTLCKARNVVERCVNRLTQFPDLAIRYARRGHYYRAEVVLASLTIRFAT